MGELTKTEQLTGWLSKVGNAQQMWAAAINSDDRLRIAFAEAEAKLALLESLDETIAAYLLRFCDPKLQMVEVVNNPTDEEKVRITAMAILTGLVPGNDDFAVFGGKGGAKLYIKENGYRKLFAKLSGCTAPDVQTGHPVFTDLGNGKKVWRVSGKASCERHTQPYDVERVGDFAIGIPGYDSDNVAGISAKAQRRLLQLLWRKVVNVGMDDYEEEQPASTVTVEPVKVIEQPQQQTGADTWDGTWREYAKQHGNNSAGVAIARAMRQAQSVELLQAAAIEADAAKAQKDIDQRTYDKLKHYLVFLEAQFNAHPAGVA
jgi:hypothetical protein